MRGIDTGIFEIRPPTNIKFFVDGADNALESTTLYFSGANRTYFDQAETMMGKIEVISGAGSEVKESIYQSIVNEVGQFEGHVFEPFDEEDRYTFSSIFESNGKEYRQTHSILETLKGYLIHITFLQGFVEDDISEIEEMMSKATFGLSSAHVKVGDYLQMKFSHEDIEFRIGNRYNLKTA